MWRLLVYRDKLVFYLFGVLNLIVILLLDNGQLFSQIFFGYIGVDISLISPFINYLISLDLKNYTLELIILLNSLWIIYILYKFMKYINNIYKIYSFNSVDTSQLPYKLDTNLFIKIIPFQVNNSTIIKKDIIIEIQNLLSKKQNKILIKAEFGMGKTSICQVLNQNNKSFYLNKELLDKVEIKFDRDYTDVEIVDLLINSYINKKKIFASYKYFLVKYFYFKKTILIFDALDEMNLSSSDFKNFENMLKNTKFLFVCTVREEYTKKFKIKLNSILLNSWSLVECLQYTTLIKKGLEKYENNKLVLFEEKIKYFFNESFYSRPLFLNMLIYLEVLNSLEMNNVLKIEPNLISNLAELYYKYIFLHIEHEVTRINFNNETDAEELSSLIFIDLKRFAVNKYLKLDNEIYSEYFLRLLEDKKHSLGILKYNINEKAKIKKYEKHDFVHKSFFDYLLGYALAESVLKSFPDINKLQNAECDNIWSIFQTHEISTHFTNDVIRRIQTEVNKKYNSNLKSDYFINISNEFFKRAFMKILLNCDLKKYEYSEYSEYEKVEQVLSYLGRFNLSLTDEEILKIKSKIYTSSNTKRDDCHFVYYRTACLTFANIIDIEYIVDYVKYLYNNEYYIQLDKEIQKNYYGNNITNLRVKLLNNYLKPYLYDINVKSNFSHILFSFFTIDKFTQQDIEILNNFKLNSVEELFIKIKTKALENNDNYVIEICKLIEGFLIGELYNTKINDFNNKDISCQ